MSFRLLQCLGIKNPCYTRYKGINLVPEGIVVHTTDANNKTIKRYVEPAAGQTSGMSDNGETVSASRMSAILGDNLNNNSWNRSGATAAVHAFIGTVANGSLAVCQFLPWQSPCWGSGSGPNGTVNGCYNGKAKAPLYVQFEICEGPHSDLEYCRKTYQMAVELCAYLIKMFPTIKIENILGHKEVYEQGKSSVRADPIKYWTSCKSGYTMDGFRRDVKAALKAPETATGSDIYRVQVGAFRSKAYAENYLSTVQKVFPNAFITKGGG
jgi:N-acetylmuramoyl-L-alanine amidase